MRDPRKKSAAAAKGKGKGKSKSKREEEAMELDAEAPSTSNPKVWRPGIDPIDEDEELEYDATAYDCLHRFQVDWPCLSFDVLRDSLGAPRSTFPHTAFLIAGTQAATPRQNYLAFLKLGRLGQGRHGKKGQQGSDSDDDDSDEDDEGEEGMEREREEKPGEPPAQFHYRMVAHTGGINRVRSMPQQSPVVAVWGDNAQVKVLDGSKLVSELASETEPSGSKGAGGKAGSQAPKQEVLKPLATHTHGSEGFALDWSRVKAGRLASGDGRGKIHVWEPQEGGRWAVGGAHVGHGGSVEDVQWSPTEETVFASCSADRTIRVWDTRERARPMLTAADAHATDVNVVSWNGSVTYMLASGADDGSLRVWDLRTFASASAAPPAAGAAEGGAGGVAHVAQLAFHRSHVTSVEWCPYEGSMLASCSADNQLAVWDLALERDPEEEAALAPEGNAAAPDDLPAQLLFLHAGQQDPKELHWHAQIPGVIISTAADGFNLFKASNM